MLVTQKGEISSSRSRGNGTRSSISTRYSRTFRSITVPSVGRDSTRYKRSTNRIFTGRIVIEVVSDCILIEIESVIVLFICISSRNNYICIRSNFRRSNCIRKSRINRSRSSRNS